MLTTPAELPVTVADKPAPIGTTGAMPGPLLLHTPPGSVSVKVVVCPTHIVVIPIIPGGTVSMIIEVLIVQPVGRV